MSDVKTDLRKSLKSIFEDLIEAENGPDRNTYGFKNRLQVIYEDFQDLELRICAEFGLGDFGVLSDFESTHYRREDSGMDQMLKSQIKKLAIEIDLDLTQSYKTKFLDYSENKSSEIISSLQYFINHLEEYKKSDKEGIESSKISPQIREFLDSLSLSQATLEMLRISHNDLNRMIHHRIKYHKDSTLETFKETETGYDNLINSLKSLIENPAIKLKKKKIIREQKQGILDKVFKNKSKSTKEPEMVNEGKSNKPTKHSIDMVEAKFTQIRPQRDPHNDLLLVNGVSDLERGRLTVHVFNDAGKKLYSEMSFQTKIDGTWGPIHCIILQKIPPQRITLHLTPRGETTILDEKIFEWKGMEKSKPINLPEDLLNAQPRISIPDLIDKLENGLRKVVLKDPTCEFDIHDAIEQLLVGTNYEDKYTRDSESIPVSGKSYRKPDFVIEDLNLALEAKLCNSKGDVKKIIDEMNADIFPYQKKHDYIIFLVYDFGGFIADMDEFVKDFHSRPNIRVIIVKH